MVSVNVAVWLGTLFTRGKLFVGHLLFVSKVISTVR